MGPLFALGVAKAGYSWWQGQERARQQSKETDEVLRRARLTRDRTLSATRAIGAASGIEFESGSLQTYLRTMADEFSRQIDLMSKAGYGAADATQIASNLNLFSDLGSSMFNVGQASNWWQTPQGAG